MGLHFKTASEEHLDRYSRISPAVLSAIENNRDAFMALMSKIFEETNEELIQIHHLNPNEAEDHDQLQGETSDHEASPELIEKVKGLVLAVYLTSFFVQDIPFLEETLQHAHHNGVEDGHAYVNVKRMRRN